MELDPDFTEFIACCVRRDVRFLVVGGYAPAAHLVINKRASGRLQDLADSAALTEGNPGPA